jgi:hypothetical protein
MITVNKSFHRLAAVAGVLVTAMVFVLLVVLLLPGHEPALAQSRALQVEAPAPPPPLDPPAQGPVLNRHPAQSVDHAQLQSDVNALEFKPQLRVQLGDHPQPPLGDGQGAGKTGAREQSATPGLVGQRSDAQSRAAQASQLQAAGWTLRGLEDFEGAFGTGVTCGFSGEAWSLEDYGPDGFDRTWGDDDYRPWYGSWSAWPAAGGADALDPQLYYYPDNLDSWMICGPFDFSNAADVFVDFGLWLDSELYYDWFYFGASLDDLTYDVYYWSGYSAGWLYEPFWLTNYAGYSQVWLAWIFSSDFSNPVNYEGAWVDEIAIWTYELPPVDEGNLVENGSFEEGGAPWLSFTSTVQLQATTSNVSPLYRAAVEGQSPRAPEQALAPNDSYLTDLTAVHGSWSALMYADGELNDFLWQTITVPLTATDVELDFWFAVTTNEVQQGQDWFCASLTDGSFSTLIVDLGCMDAAYTTGYWQEVLYTLTGAEVQDAVAAGTVNLVFELYNRGSPGTGTAAWIDYVRLYAAGAGTYIDVNEPNDDAGQATGISCGGTVSGTIGDALVGYGDLDWFVLNSVPVGRLDLDLNAQSKVPPSALDAVLYLVADDQTTLLEWNDDDGQTYDSYLVYTNSVPNATFYVAVESYSGYGGPDSFYDLTASCAGGGSGPPPPPTTPPGASDTWTVMLYLNAEDRSFEPTLKRYISDMQSVLNGKTGFMTVTVLYDGPARGDTVRYQLQPSGVYTNGVNLWPLNEQNVGDPDTLAAFAGWSMDNYPAENYYLAIDDHGHGVYGISWDATNSNDSLTPPELYSALKEATHNGARKIDVLDYEACLMGMAEHAYDVRQWVDYVVFFEQISWGINTYPNYFSNLQPIHTPLQVGQRIVNQYHTQADNEGYPHTISLIDTSQMAGVKQASTALGDALVATNNITAVQNARVQSQAFAAADDATNPALADYIDLWDLADKSAGLPGVGTAAGQVKSAVENAVVAEQHTSLGVGGYYWDHSGVHGLSIYYPASNASGAFNDYIAPRLFQMSSDESGINGHWDEFLAWAVTTGGNGASNGIGGGDRKGMNGFRFLQPKLGGDSFIYLPLIIK